MNLKLGFFCVQAKKGFFTNPSMIYLPYHTIVPSGRNSNWGREAAHCVPSHSVYYYKGNILQFDNHRRGGRGPPTALW